MDEMRVLAEYGRGVALVAPQDLAPAQARLAAEMAAESATPPGRRARSRTAKGGRFSLSHRGVWAACAIGAAAAVTAAVVLVPETVGDKVPAANAEAAQILDQAAFAVLDEPFVEPRPDQFLYRHDGAYENWSSVDGTRDGLVISAGERTPLPGCRDGKADIYKGSHRIGTEACAPSPAYRKDLPTDADAMYQYLLRTNSPDSDGFTNRLAKNVVDLMSMYLRPQSRAALLQAAGRFPGLTVTRDATGKDGRRGIAVGWSNSGFSNVFIFDPVTYMPVGPVSAIVDQVEQRP